MSTTHVRQSWNRCVSSALASFFFFSTSWVILYVTEFDSRCHRRSFSFSIRCIIKIGELCCHSDFWVYPCMLLLHSHQAGVTVIKTAPLDVEPASHGSEDLCTLARERGARPHQACAWTERQAIRVAKPKDGYEYIISWLPWCGDKSGGGLCGLIRPNSCSFVLVERVCGREEKGKKDFYRSTRPGWRDAVMTARSLLRMH